MTVTWEDLRDMAQEVAVERGHLAGYPALQPGHSIQLARGFPYPAMGRYVPNGAESDIECHGVSETEQVRNDFWSKRLRGSVLIVWHGGQMERPAKGGKPYLRPDRIEVLAERRPIENRRLDMLLSTGHAAPAWKLEAEAKAVAKVAELLTAHQFRLYFTTGTFMETSQRSGVSYLFRRLRPTIAFRSDEASGRVRVLGALCLHPIGYYTDTFAGAMVPTDDVIAHLLMMRGDEHLFWRRSNQHPIHHPQAGV